MNQLLPIRDERRHKITFDELRALIGQGFLSGKDKLELIDGVIIEMPSEGTAHVDLKAQLTEWLMGNVDKRFRVVPDSTLVLSDVNAPSPDIRIQCRDVPFSQIRGEHVALIIEIADTSLKKDLTEKAALYGRFGVSEYWVIDVDDWSVTVFRRGESGFAEGRAVHSMDEIRPASLPELSFRLSDFELTG